MAVGIGSSRGHLLDSRLDRHLRSKDNGGLLNVSLFFLVVLLLGLTVVTQGLQIRPRGADIGVLLGTTVVYFMVLVRMTMAERTHLIEYSVLAVFVHEALSERRGQGRRVPKPALLAILATALVGTLDEFIFLAAAMTVAALVASIGRNAEHTPNGTSSHLPYLRAPNVKSPIPSELQFSEVTRPVTPPG